MVLPHQILANLATTAIADAILMQISAELGHFGQLCSQVLDIDHF